MFSRGAPTRRQGIGLAVCRRVSRRTAAIWVEPAEGGGSEFWFTLPD